MISLLLILTLCEQALLGPVSQLVVLPRPYQDNKVKAVIDERFFLTCFSQSSHSANALKWLSPNGQSISTDFTQRIYTNVNNEQLMLHFEKLEAADAGTYTCEGVHNGLAEQVKVELGLEKRISFDNTKLQQFINAGGDELVECRASSIPGPEIAWFRNGINTNLKNSHKYQITNDGLVIKNAQVEDEGVYLCQASVSSTGEIKRAQIHVEVMHKPVWHVKPADTDAVNGQDVVIKCKASAKPVAKYTWYRNGVVLAGERYVTSVDSLRIVEVNVNDRGTYTCQAENNSGKISANFRLNVLVGPVIAPMEPVRVLEGKEAVVKCVVIEAFPKALITWKYADTLQSISGSSDSSVEIVDDGAEDGGDNLVGSWSELRIKPADRKYNRNVTCMASNKAQVTERQVRLVVEYVPKLLINSESRQVYYSWLSVDASGSSGSSSSHVSRGAAVTMTCIATGEPVPKITWFFKSEQIKHDNVKYVLRKDQSGVSQLEVIPDKESDFDTYQCKAENRAGHSFRNIELRMATSPRLAPLLLLQSTLPESVDFKVTLSQETESNGGLPIHTVKVQWRFLNSDWTNQNERNFAVNSVEHMSIHVDALLPHTEYLFRVAGVNKVGQGQWSKEIKIKTLNRRQPQPIRVLSKEDCSASTRCYIEWAVDSNGGSPVRDYLVKWRRLSYKDSSNQHVDTSRLGSWSSVVVINAPVTNYEITNILPNSFYEVDVVARNDIGPSASQPFRIRTLPGQIGELEAFKKPNESVINRVILICGSVIAAIILFIIIDVLLLMKFECGLLAILTKSCANQKEIPIDFKPTPTKIVQHTPKSNNPYMPINQSEEAPAHVSIPLRPNEID
ncbi:fasciclin-2 isoform X3 [Brachionus plicatilis]|uniref:Fasciclin-2 isoform X3 n=1 Tax=Brachionus plicatilis TaxID=10195 RepID=A0A3M7RZ45_BRAPC|nr:fasciclin-2 isoform X3 [Brachionus plicatilis]